MRRSTRDYYLNERGSNNDDHDDNNNINNDNINNKDWTKSGRGKCLVLPLVSYCFERTKSPLTWNGKGGGGRFTILYCVSQFYRHERWLP